jgi:hypothetical protein
MTRFILFTLLEVLVGLCLTAILIYPYLTLSIRTGLLCFTLVPYLYLVNHNKLVNDTNDTKAMRNPPFMIWPFNIPVARSRYPLRCHFLSFAGKSKNITVRKNI